jgi:transcriptional regulator with XRE-family HTH domain
VLTGPEIRTARERIGLTQEQFADAVGANLRTVGNWERGTTTPRNSEARIRSVLGLDEADTSPRLRSATDRELLNEISRRLEDYKRRRPGTSTAVVDADTPTARTRKK